MIFLIIHFIEYAGLRKPSVDRRPPAPMTPREPKMREADDWDRQIVNACPRSERWDALKREALRRAHEARSQAIREAIAMLIALPRRGWRHAAERFGRLRPQPAACRSHPSLLPQT
jgi:hypothetical protein